MGREEVYGKFSACRHRLSPILHIPAAAAETAVAAIQFLRTAPGVLPQFFKLRTSDYECDKSE